MKRVYALGFIFLDVVLGQGAGAAIPGSAIHCLRSTAAECDSGDVVCLCSACKRKERIAELSSCIKKGCKPDEVVPAEDSYGPLNYVDRRHRHIDLNRPCESWGSGFSINSESCVRNDCFNEHRKLNSLNRQVEVAEIDGRPAPQELPA
ncbi:CFEM domain-containing protein [Fusarium sp. Ph1]|nr:CFEM domain-containing protein [Fusarium sp. Ph1]